MLRSLYSSISGLRNHQVRMDVIGNNIANVNTTGYKTTRVTFEESISQLMASATRPREEAGGINPMQVGLGMSVGAVDSKFTQGNLESTGKITDLSIEGKAFFAVSDGNESFYTRNGAFGFDSQGKMVMSNSGYVLQGKLADQLGSFPTGAPITDIKIPFNDQSPANATAEVQLARNLDSASGATGTVLHTQTFLHHAEGTDSTLDLFDGKGNNLGIKAGDILTFSALNGANAQVTASLTVSDTTTMNDIVGSIQSFLQTSVDGSAQANLVTMADDIANATNLRGAMTIFGNTAAIRNFQVTSNRPVSGPLVTKAFAVPGTIPGATARLNITTDTFRGTSRAGDLLAESFDSTGNSLGLENGDSISFTGEVGQDTASDASPLVYASNTTTFQNMMDSIRENFKLPDRDGTPEDNASVSFSDGLDMPRGSLVVRGMPGQDFAIKNMTILASNSNNSSPAPSNFNANLTGTRFQAAKDTGVFDTSISVFDDLGGEHTLSVRFTHTGQPNRWLWEADTSGDADVTQGQNGTLTFGQDGSVSSFSFDDGASQLAIDPKNGAAPIRVNLRVGGPGDFRGLTQFRSPTTASAVSQDGYTMGRLREISIDEVGVITGAFTNGISKSLAQIMIVDFTNPNGLLKLKESVYTVSSNSGDPIFGMPGSQSSSIIKPGALELSNVELAQEFTDMITTQRGYQANARVITVSDSLLEELVALKR